MNQYSEENLPQVSGCLSYCLRKFIFRQGFLKKHILSSFAHEVLQDLFIVNKCDNTFFINNKIFKFFLKSPSILSQKTTIFGRWLLWFIFLKNPRFLSRGSFNFFFKCVRFWLGCPLNILPSNVRISSMMYISTRRPLSN